MRLHSLSLALLLLPTTLVATTIAPTTSAPAAPAVHGVVADATGAIVPNAEVDLLDTTGTVAGTIHSDGEGNFQLAAPHAGNYTLVVSEPGFETVRTPIVVAARGFEIRRRDSLRRFCPRWLRCTLCCRSRPWLRLSA